LEYKVLKERLIRPLASGQSKITKYESIILQGLIANFFRLF